VTRRRSGRYGRCWTKVWVPVIGTSCGRPIISIPGVLVDYNQARDHAVNISILQYFTCSFLVGNIFNIIYIPPVISIIMLSRTAILPAVNFNRMRSFFLQFDVYILYNITISTLNDCAIYIYGTIDVVNRIFPRFQIKNTRGKILNIPSITSAYVPSSASADVNV